MVTTGYDTAAIVSGKIRIDLNAITPAEWDVIITAAIKELTIGYLSCLETIGQLLLPPRNGVSTEYDVRSLFAPDLNADPTLLQPDFLMLGIFQEVPNWRNWPRTSHTGRYDEVCESILTLRRGKHGTTKLVQLDIFWQLEELQTGEPLSHKLRAKLIVIRQDISIGTLFDSCGAHAHHLGRQVLWNLYSAQRGTAASANERATAAQKAAQTLESYLMRASVL